jgi:hypothetical protein
MALAVAGGWFGGTYLTRDLSPFGGAAAIAVLWFVMITGPIAVILWRMRAAKKRSQIATARSKQG